MALKVQGSIPWFYPTHINIYKGTTKTNSFNKLIYIYKISILLLSKLNIKNNSILTNIWHFYFKVIINKSNKFIFKYIFNFDKMLTTNQNPSINQSVSVNKSLNKLIHNFLFNSKFLLNYNKFKVHASFKIYYIFNKNMHIGIWNLNKMLNVWKNLFILINNIFFFNIKYTIFSNIYFKKEVLYLNHSKNLIFKNFWRYTTSYLFFFNSKKTLREELYFKYLLLKNYKISFIIDLYYHKSTMYFINKYKFLSIGPVPVSSNIYLLNIAFPVPSNLMQSNYFFIKTVFHIKKKSMKKKYNNFLIK